MRFNPLMAGGVTTGILNLIQRSLAAACRRMEFEFLSILRERHEGRDLRRELDREYRRTVRLKRSCTMRHMPGLRSRVLHRSQKKGRQNAMQRAYSTWRRP